MITSSSDNQVGQRGRLLQHMKRSTLLTMWKTPWPVWVGAMAFGFANVLMFMYARAIGVFPQMSMWGAQFYNAVGIEVDAPFVPYPLEPIHLNLHSMINFGVVLGVFFAATLAREFKFRVENPKGCLTGFVGGVLMGFGTVITPPCNVGGFFSATMALSLSGPLMAVGLLLGAYVGGLYLRNQVVKASMDIDFSAAKEGTPAKSSKSSRQPFFSIVFVLLFVVGVLLLMKNNMPKHAGLLVFGAAFGIICQRSRLCFAAAFREILLNKNGSMMKTILVSIALSSIAFTILKSSGHKVDHFVLPMGIHTVVGAFIFGIGMVIAGGCGVGVLWRSAEGYMRSWFALIGGMLSAGSWVLIYGKHVGEGWLYGKPVFLPNHFGWIGALAMVLLFLGLFYLFITWLEVGKREKTNTN